MHRFAYLWAVFLYCVVEFFLLEKVMPTFIEKWARDLPLDWCFGRRTLDVSRKPILEFPPQAVKKNLRENPVSQQGWPDLARRREHLWRSAARYILLCDDVRREDNGKFILIGLYTPDIARAATSVRFADAEFLSQPGVGSTLDNFRISYQG